MASAASTVHALPDVVFKARISMSVLHTDLAQRIEESFAEIEDEAIADFRKTNEEYYALYQQILKLKADHPFISKVMDGSGGISYLKKVGAL